MIKIIIATILIFFINGCGNSSSKGFGEIQLPKVCSNEANGSTEEKRYVHALMHDTYFWADQTPTLDYSSNSYNLTKLLEDLKNPKDKWSYITTTKAYNQYFQEGRYSGFGFRAGWADDNKSWQVVFVYPDSPADKAGLKRSDIIQKVNGTVIKEYNSTQPILGESKKGVWRVLSVKSTDGILKDMNMSKDYIRSYSVLKKSVLEQDGKKIGYLLFNSFVEPSREELDSAFEYFKTKNLDAFILDLRYNGGGRLNIASYLSSYIAGDKINGIVMEKLIHNSKYTSMNKTLKFGKAPKNSLDLNELYIITTNSSCSASESVVNALSASATKMKIYTIGESTCGKPMGMYGRDFCDKHISPIEFKGVNADGYGEYFDGIKPICKVSDDITHDFSDLNESMLKETLYFIKNSTCSSKNNRSKRVSKTKKSEIYTGFQREIGAF